MQETFLAIWKGACKYRGDSSVSTWVIGIARNKAMDVLRKLYKSPEDLTLCEYELALGEDDFTDSIVNSITIDDILENLSPEAKELFHIIFILDMSYREAAHILDIPEGTVKSRMNTLRKKIRNMLKEGGGCIE